MSFFARLVGRNSDYSQVQDSPKAAEQVKPKKVDKKTAEAAEKAQARAELLATRANLVSKIETAQLVSKEAAKEDPFVKRCQAMIAKIDAALN